MISIHIIGASGKRDLHHRVRRARRSQQRLMNRSFDFRHAPGHLIRRAHQKSVAIFMEEVAGADITPVQFAILNALIDEPGADQVTLAARVGFDAATSGSVIGRLEAKGWVRRESDPGDRRRKLLWITPPGEQVARSLRRAAARAQQRMLAGLDPAERTLFVALLERLIRH